VSIFILMMVPDWGHYTLTANRFVSFLLRIAHDRASGKKTEDPEATMKAQIKQLVAQIQTGEEAKQNTGHRGGASHGLTMGIPGESHSITMVTPVRGWSMAAHTTSRSDW
jgi:hypothetical protein